MSKTVNHQPALAHVTLSRDVVIIDVICSKLRYKHLVINC